MPTQINGNEQHKERFNELDIAVFQICMGKAN